MAALSATVTFALDANDSADAPEVTGSGGVHVIVSSGAGWPVEGVTLSIGGETLGVTGVDGQAILEDVAAGQQVLQP